MGSVDADAAAIDLPQKLFLANNTVALLLGIFLLRYPQRLANFTDKSPASTPADCYQLSKLKL